MTFIQFLIIAFALLVIIQIFLGFKKKAFAFKELLFWLFLWVAISVVVLLPQTTGFFAKILGVGRGSDVAVYLAIVLILYLIFRIFVKLEKIKSDITDIVRKIALQDKDVKMK